LGEIGNLSLNLALAAAATLINANAAWAEDYSDDMPLVRQFLDLDASYSPAERAKAESAYSALAASADNLSPAEFQLAVARIAAYARNGHTMLVAGVWPFQFNRTPLRYYMFADGLRVVEAPSDMEELVGAEVLSIDGKSPAKLDRSFAEYYGARDGRRREWLGYFIESPAILNAAGLANTGDRATVKLRLLNGENITRIFDAAIEPPDEQKFAFFSVSRLVQFPEANIEIGKAPPLYLREPGRPFRFEMLDDIDAAYIQIRVNVSRPEENLPEFGLESLRTIEKEKPRYLIFDLRFDGGGDLNLTRDLMEGAAKLLPDNGRVFIVTSGRTFSAGIASAAYLKQAAPDKTIIVGDAIGDDLEYWAEGDLIELPLSGAVLLPATERHNYMTGCPESDCHAAIRDHPIRIQSLEPDVSAPLTYADYSAGIDPALDAIREMIGDQSR
jgi:hypothetical protein